MGYLDWPCFLQFWWDISAGFFYIFSGIFRLSFFLACLVGYFGWSFSVYFWWDVSVGFDSYIFGGSLGRSFFLHLLWDISAVFLNDELKHRSENK